MVTVVTTSMSQQALGSIKKTNLKLKYKARFCTQENKILYQKATIPEHHSLKILYLTNRVEVFNGGFFLGELLASPHPACHIENMRKHLHRNYGSNKNILVLLFVRCCQMT